jgi:hypothetical protein
MGLTVREYIARPNNPQTTIATEEYAIAVGAGFYWYSLAMTERGSGNILCFPNNMALGRSIVLQAANRAIDNSNGATLFEQALSCALAEIFPPT